MFHSVVEFLISLYRTLRDYAFNIVRGMAYVRLQGHNQCWAPQVFFFSPQSASPQPNFNSLNPQPQVRNCTFKSLVRNRKSATTFQDS